MIDISGTKKKLGSVRIEDSNNNVVNDILEPIKNFWETRCTKTVRHKVLGSLP